MAKPCGNGRRDVMGAAASVLLRILAVLPLIATLELHGLAAAAAKFSRKDFPSDFVFGAGSSAYQYEGAVAEDGRSPSIWDTFTHQGKMPDRSTADVTTDGYHNYEEDVKLMSDVGLEAYRFSISWSRLIPNGRGPVNPKGLKYYNDFINELVMHGIQPHVTLYHFDLPQVLEDEYGGWLSSNIVEDFTAYADVCFREFGDRVSHWTTTNQANVMTFAAYDSGEWAPGRCSKPFGLRDCPIGNSTIEPYIALHNFLLAHASAVNLYRNKYKVVQKGFIGLTVYTFCFVPNNTQSSADVKATQRAFDFMIGWLLNPVVYGDYPSIMRDIVGTRLPVLTNEQSALVKGSFDFIGINHYSTLKITDTTRIDSEVRDFFADMAVKFVKSNVSPGQSVPEQVVDADGMEKVLKALSSKYGNPAIYIYENGFGTNPDVTLNDTDRIDAVSEYIAAVLAALRNGSNMKGYFVWSFMDCFEFLYGYRKQFGLYHVDLASKELQRIPKRSAFWYRDFLKNNKVVIKTIGMQRSIHLGGQLLDMRFATS